MNSECAEIFEGARGLKSSEHVKALTSSLRNSSEAGGQLLQVSQCARKCLFMHDAYTSAHWSKGRDGPRIPACCAKAVAGCKQSRFRLIDCQSHRVRATLSFSADF